eukprot:gene12679-15910_t
MSLDIFRGEEPGLAIFRGTEPGLAMSLAIFRGTEPGLEMSLAIFRGKEPGLAISTATPFSRPHLPFNPSFKIFLYTSSARSSGRASAEGLHELCPSQTADFFSATLGCRSWADIQRQARVIGHTGVGSVTQNRASASTRKKQREKVSARVPSVAVFFGKPRRPPGPPEYSRL